MAYDLIFGLGMPVLALVGMASCVRAGLVRPIALVGLGLVAVGSVAGRFVPPKDMVWFAVQMTVMVAGMGTLLIGLAPLLRNIRRRRHQGP